MHRQIGYDLILSLIPKEVRVLDLGCGTGELLEKLQNQKKVKGFGVEISESGVSECVEKGLYCFQGDIDEALSDYRDNSFDFVILNQTLQNTKRPDYVVHETLRISKKAIISFPNYGYIMTRLGLLLKGTMPKSELNPYEWYESPDIHMLTIKDFLNYCKKYRYSIERELHFSLSKAESSKIIHWNPNLMAQYGFFILNGYKVTSE